MTPSDAAPSDTLAASDKCRYCQAQRDDDGCISHAAGCAGLQEVRISRLRLDWLRAHPESVAYEFPPIIEGQTS
jgi:hypothetical protein